jgi:hypothetical protein
MKLLPWVSATLSILSFFWIGFRREKEGIKKEYDAAKSAPEQASIVFWFLLPYLLGAAGVLYLFVASLQPQPIVISHHIVREVQGCKGDPVKVDGRTKVPITCSEKEPFSFTVSGQFFGPELEQLRERFGTLEAVHMYIVVQEYRENTRGLVWLQVHGSGNLDSLGQYKSKGYLGGTGNNRAEEGDLFSIMIFIPDQGAKFKPTPYSLAELPKPLFLSDPLYITTHGRERTKQP